MFVCVCVCLCVCVAGVLAFFVFDRKLTIFVEVPDLNFYWVPIVVNTNIHTHIHSVTIAHIYVARRK
jgi:hypothetical protein